MSFHVIIPARYASSRFPGKPLADLGGRPMVVRVCERAVQSGAASVLAPLWDAPIAAVQACTEAFLEGWAGLGLPKALALRRAMREMSDGSFGSSPERLGVMTLRGDWL